MRTAEKLRRVFRIYGREHRSASNNRREAVKITIRHFIFNVAFPAIGFIVCFVIWINLPLKTFVIGGSWLAAGLLYLLIKTKGFKTSLL